MGSAFAVLKSRLASVARSHPAIHINGEGMSVYFKITKNMALFGRSRGALLLILSVIFVAGVQAETQRIYVSAEVRLCVTHSMTDPK